MSYILKKDVAEEIKKKYKGTYLMKTIGISKCYVSLILNRKKNIPKPLAYSLTKAVDKEAEIEDLFEVA